MIDEYPILEIPKTAGWSENYALEVGSEDPRVGLLYSIGRWHSEPTIWRESVGLVLDDRSVLFAKNYGRNSLQTGVSASLTAWNVIEPERKLRFTFDGPVREATLEQSLEQGVRDGATKRCCYDLTFDAEYPIWNMKGDSVGASTIAGSLHYEQIGKISGTIHYDGREIRLVDGYGARDHSRGVRDVSNYHSHCWINARLPGNRAFHLYAMQLLGLPGMAMSNAAVLQDGRWYSAEVVETAFVSGPSDRLQPYTIILRSELGEMVIRVKEMLTTVATGVANPFDVSPGALSTRGSLMVFDQFARFELDGQESVGWSERGYRK